MKTYITAFIILLSLSLFFRPAMAQSPLNGHSGLYLTADDYLKKNLTHDIDCASGNEKFRTDKLFGESKFEIIYKGKKYNYQKKDVFGYRDCNNKDFRFIHNGEFEILDGQFFFLYRYFNYKGIGKDIIPVAEYFISKDANGSLVKLTLANLKSMYPDNRKFQELLDKEFSSGEELTAFEPSRQMYKIKRIYLDTLN